MANQPTQTVYDERGNPIQVDPQQFQQAVVGQASSAPQMSQSAEQVTQTVYTTRPHDLAAPEITPEVQQKHDESKRQYPYLNLSSGEYVISAVRRHPIGILAIWAVVGIALLMIASALMLVINNTSRITTMLNPNSIPSLALLLVGLMVFIFLGGVLATVVYNGNRFFLTNESVTQHIQISLFSKKEQTVNLSNIEDASFRQHGIIQTLLNYGSLRLSTQGDETTYRFNFVDDPAHQVALLNDAVESFKMGRPVDYSD